jgi:hypothetical protein
MQLTHQNEKRKSPLEKNSPLKVLGSNWGQNYVEVNMHYTKCCIVEEAYFKKKFLLGGGGGGG